MTSIGMNLSAVNYWSTAYPFLDRMKSAGAWSIQGANPGKLTLDANGYPMEMPTGADRIYTMIAVDPASANTSNIYEMTYIGSATFRIGNATILSSGDGKVVFEYNGTSTMAQVMVTSITSPISEMHIVRQDQVGLFEGGEIFNPAFLEKVSGFDTLRYMDWGATNGSTISAWSDRTTISDMSWASTTENASVPIEVMVALANKTLTNMWVNIPIQADDTYIRNQIQYIHDNLDPTLTVSIEYSNEVWNWGFPQAKYALQAAANLWGADLNSDGVIDINTEGVQGGSMIYYGYRSAQIADISHSIFGEQSEYRVKNVIGTQIVHLGLEDYIFEGVAKAKLGSVVRLFDDYAVTSYFGSNINGRTASDRTEILSWARSGAAGVDAAFAEIEAGGRLSPGGSLASLAAWYGYQAEVAKKSGLNLVAYEGGVDLAASKFSADVQPEIIAFFSELQNDPRMGELYTRMLADFSAAGGTLLNVFNDAQSDRVSGAYGTLDTIYDETSPAYAALMAALAANDLSTAFPPGGVVTVMEYYTLGVESDDVTYIGVAGFTARGSAASNVIRGGEFGNTLYGNAGDDTLLGGAGADLLDGGAGIDTMAGRAGDDVYIVDTASDVVTEDVDAGLDEVRTVLATHTLGANIEKLTYVGDVAFVGIGNALDNVIVGGRVANRLAGNDGADSLIGGSGADTLDGGRGADRMVGGAGNDTYIVESTQDFVFEASDSGYDQVVTTLGTFRLGANLENLVYAGTVKFVGYGNDLANVLTGASGGNTLYGGGGVDTLFGGSGDDYLNGGPGGDKMTGGVGNDIYIFDNANDTASEQVSGGIDTIRTTLETGVLAPNVEYLTFIGTGDFIGIGNSSDNVLRGGAQSNRLYGAGGNDKLIGGDGADIFDGGTGADQMVGGSGHDIYYVDNIYDKIYEELTGGGDDVYSTVSYTLGANIEGLRLTGSGSDYGIGNEVANNITGNGGDNRLYGLAGNDLILARDGKDHLEGGAGDDTLLGENGNDYILGGFGNDALNGGAGDDILIGGVGKDTANGGEGADRYVFALIDLNAAPGLTDTIFDFKRADGDVIDLSGIDSIRSTAGDDAFRFIGMAAFTKQAGELRVDTHGGHWNILGDINGDGTADFSLLVSKSAGDLVANDFAL